LELVLRRDELEEWVSRYAKALEEHEDLAWKGHEKIEAFKEYAMKKWAISEEEFEEASLKAMLKFGSILTEEWPDLENPEVLRILLRLQIATIIIAVQDLAIEKMRNYMFVPANMLLPRGEWGERAD